MFNNKHLIKNKSWFNFKRVIESGFNQDTISRLQPDAEVPNGIGVKQIIFQGRFRTPEQAEKDIKGTNSLEFL